jgi:hypothetical protein
MTLSVCLIAWGYSRVLRYAVFTVDVVTLLMWGRKLSVAMQLKRRPPRLCKSLNCGPGPRSYFKRGAHRNDQVYTHRIEHACTLYIFVIADASRVQSCCNQAVCRGGSLDARLARSTTPKPQTHQATKRAEQHYSTDLGPRVRLLR